MTMAPLVETRVRSASRGYYDPTTGQFTSPDPLDAITRERYGFAGNDPVNGMDPMGLFGWSSITHAAHDVVAAPGHVVHTVNNDIVHPVAHATAAAGEWAWDNRGTIATGAAIGVCIGTGGAGCAAAAAVAFVVRAQQRVEEHGFNDSLKANLADLGVTALTLGVGSVAEEGILAEEGAGESLDLLKYAMRAEASGMGIGLFVGDRVSGGDMFEPEDDRACP